MHLLHPGLGVRKAADRGLSLRRGGEWATRFTRRGGAKAVPAVGTSLEELPFLTAGHCVGRVTRAPMGVFSRTPGARGLCAPSATERPCRRHRESPYHADATESPPTGFGVTSGSA